jgi:hypothetical protein
MKKQDLGSEGMPMQKHVELTGKKAKLVDHPHTYVQCMHTPRTPGEQELHVEKRESSS